MKVRAMRGWMRRRVRAVATVGLAAAGALGLFVASAPPAGATGPTVSGAGSTWVQIALDQWRADVAARGLTINYQSVGSSAGRQFYITGQVDFAASEIPFQPNEVQQLQGEGKSWQYLPDVAGGTSLMYNLHQSSGARINNLNLDSDTAAKIFTGVIKNWTDPAIEALNPGITLPEEPVVPVIRSDGSGTSAQFSLYLAAQASAVWNAFVQQYGCPAPCSYWPTFPGSVGQRGSDGVANFIANDAIGKGAIGYVEAGFAYEHGFYPANLKNASAHFVQPTATNVSTALTHATLNADLTQNLTKVYSAPEANAYPMSSYSYMITETSGFDPAKGAVLGAWIIYIACAGQREAAPLGYSPLPKNLVAADFEAVKRIPGAPAPPPLDAAHCPNPTITGEGTSGGPPPPPPQVPGGGDQGSSSGTAGSSNQFQSGSAGDTSGSDTTLIPEDPTSASPGNIETLTPGERRARFTLAVRQASYARRAPALPLIIAALTVLGLVFGPLLLQFRGPGGDRRGTGGPA